jgi:hypothetical protein
MEVAINMEADAKQEFSILIIKSRNISAFREVVSLFQNKLAK